MLPLLFVSNLRIPPGNECFSKPDSLIFNRGKAVLTVRGDYSAKKKFFQLPKGGFLRPTVRKELVN